MIIITIIHLSKYQTNNSVNLYVYSQRLPFYLYFICVEYEQQSQQKLYTISMSSRKSLFRGDQLLDAERVLINPLNHSSSKQQYSFSKAQRFDRCHTQNDTYRYYDLPSTRSRQATVIGKEERQPTSKRQTATPTALNYSYAKDGEFAYSMLFKDKKNKGFNFRLGRDDVKVNSFLTLNRGSSPDPGTYDPQKMANRKIKNQYSFSKAKKTSITTLVLPFVPGPGSYKVDTSLQQQRQLLSIHPKAGSPKIVELKIDNKKGEQKYPPLYHPKVTAKGEALDLSRIRKGAVIGHGQRYPAYKLCNPGPGQYKIFSQFIGKGKS